MYFLKAHIALDAIILRSGLTHPPGLQLYVDTFRLQGTFYATSAEQLNVQYIHISNQNTADFDNLFHSFFVHVMHCS